MGTKTYSVYILTNSKNTVMYIGITGNLERRVSEHKAGLVKGFAQKYNCQKLVYFEDFYEPQSAIDREKQLKGWLRVKKNALVESVNPEWDDLSTEWYARDPSLRSG